MGDGEGARPVSRAVRHQVHEDPDSGEVITEVDLGWFADFGDHDIGVQRLDDGDSVGDDRGKARRLCTVVAGDQFRHMGGGRARSVKVAGGVDVGRVKTINREVQSADHGMQWATQIVQQRRRCCARRCRVLW